MNSPTHGYLEADASAGGKLGCERRLLPAIPCANFRISFFFTTNPASTLPPRRELRCRPAIIAISSRWTARRASLSWKAAGGPSWFTEYNVLTGLSARSLWAFCDIRDSHRCGPRRPRAAAFIESLRLQDLQPLSFSWCLSRLARLPDHRRYRAIISICIDLGTREFEADQLLFRSGNQDHRPRARQRAAFSLRLHRSQSFSLGHAAASRAYAKLASNLAMRQMSRNIFAVRG